MIGTLAQRIELGNMPQRVQELALLNDLLFVAVVRRYPAHSPT
jgi:hypothetical protein